MVAEPWEFLPCSRLGPEENTLVSWLKYHVREEVPLHMGSFRTYHYDGQQQAVFIKEWLIFWTQTALLGNL